MSYFTPAEIAKNACVTAKTKAALPLSRLMALGIVAGGYVGLGGFLMTVVTQDVAQQLGVGVSKLLAGMVFPVGLIMVVVGGGELFTGNCIMPIGYFAGCVPLKRIIRNWSLVYVANAIGILSVAAMVFTSGLVTDTVGANALSVAVGKVNATLPQLIVKGILCNWLVAMGVWLSYGAKDIAGKCCGCFFPTMAFVASGYEHSIANIYFIPLGIWLKKNPAIVEKAGISAERLAKLDFSGFMANLIPVTIGNIIGAVFFIAVLYYIAYKPALTDE